MTTSAGAAGPLDLAVPAEWADRLRIGTWTIAQFLKILRDPDTDPVL